MLKNNKNFNRLIKRIECFLLVTTPDFEDGDFKKFVFFFNGW